ncbi:MAG: hypothetical protein II838_11170 [Lachnospiraceae bacterium]|nr:hypothetical protein [Lachnospiraceae bacterium]
MKKLGTKLLGLGMAVAMAVSIIPLGTVKAADVIDVIEIDPGFNGYADGDEPFITPTIHDDRLEINYVAWVCEADKTYAIGNDLSDPYADQGYTMFTKFENGKTYDLVLSSAVRKDVGSFAENVKHIVYNTVPMTLSEDETYYYATGTLESITVSEGGGLETIKEENKITVKKKKVSLKYDKKKQKYKLGASCVGKSKLTYKSNDKKVKVSEKGVVTIPAKWKGTVKITIKSPDDSLYTASKLTVTITVKK